MKWICSLTGWTALAVSLIASTAAFAQDSSSSTKSKATMSSSSSNEGNDHVVHQRFWAAVYGSGTPFKLASGGSYTDTYGDVTTTSAEGGVIGGGVNLNLRVAGNYWLNFGAIYRYGGYDTNISVNDTVLTAYGQRTRFHMYDFPVFVRYAGPKWRWSKYSFYELGGALRYASSPSNSYSASDTNGFFCCAPVSTDSYKRLIPGVAIGTGVVAKDDFGIKVAPEVRYIRWLSDNYHGQTVGTMRDQLEVGISFGF